MNWWTNYPWRMVQTNLRETDMEDINAEKYASDLADFGATVVLLNAAGIIASYDTELDFQTKSAYLHADSLSQIIDACHKRGIKVIARTDFSKVRYELYEKHPEWAYRTKDGNIVSYNGDVHVCPNGDYQQKYMFEILKEVLGRFPFDGVFCNMSGFLVLDYSGNYYGPCHCENCQKKFREQFGLEIPDKDEPGNPVYMHYTAFKNSCTKEHKERIYKTVKAIRPDIAVNGFDYIRSESNTEIGRAQWMYSASSNSRMTSGPMKERPADNACVDFIGFRYRDISVSPQLVALRQWQNLANAGSASLYIMGRLDNHKDVSSFGPTKKAFEFHKKHEDLFTHMKSAARVLLTRPLPRNYPDPESQGWVRILTNSHIPFDEIEQKEISAQVLSGKDVLILGESRRLDDKTAAMIDAFAENGGTVIADGETGLISAEMKPLERPVLQCLGITSVKQIRHDCMSSMYEIQDSEKDAFPRCAETPYIMPGSVIVTPVVSASSRGYMKLVGEHPFGPPERCYFTQEDVTPDAGVFVTGFGKGRGIYLPWKCGTVYYKEGYQNTLSFVQDVLFGLAGIPELAGELTPMAELTMNYTEGKLLLQLVNTSGVFGNSYFTPVPVRDIQIRISREYLLPGTQCSAAALNGGNASASLEDSVVSIVLDQLKDYEAIVIG